MTYPIDPTTLLECGVKVLSLDVFDTILHRVCSPERIIDLTNKKLAADLSLQHRDVATARDIAVARLRALTGSKGYDPEYRFADLRDEFVNSLTRFVTIPRDQTEDAVSRSLADEIVREISCVVPDLDIFSLAKAAHDAGFQIIAVSDMYHSRETILDLLSVVGFPVNLRPADVFVSCEHGMTKHSGRLFQHVCQTIGVFPHEILHIGDNHHSDVVSARREGLQSAHHDASDYHAYYARDRKLISSDAPLSECVRLYFETVRPANSRAVSLFAPIICHFAMSLAEEVTASGSDSVWFMARDGYLPMEVYNLIRPPSAPAGRYLHVSRKSLSAASSSSYSLREAFLAEWNSGSNKLSALFKGFPITNDVLLGKLSSYGFVSLDDEVDWKTDPRFHKLTRDPDLLAMIHSAHVSALSSLREYLDSVGFLQSDCPSVVDVGWAGQIQEALELAISAMPLTTTPRINGLYLAINAHGALRRKSGLAMKGLLHDPRRPRWDTSSVLSAVDIFEDFCRAQHGTVIGYDHGTPVLATGTESRLQEEVDDPKIAAFQKQVLDYARDFVRLARVLDLRSSDLFDLAALNAFEIVRFPNVQSYEYFGSINHALDFGGAATVTAFERVSLNPVKAARQIAASRWKEGTASTYPYGIAIQFLLLIKRILKGRHGQISRDRNSVLAYRSRHAANILSRLKFKLIALIATSRGK